MPLLRKEKVNKAKSRPIFSLNFQTLVLYCKISIFYKISTFLRCKRNKISYVICDFKIDIGSIVEHFEQDFYRAVMGITIESCDHQSLFYEVRNFNKDSALRT